jgi:HNH endonuclease
MPHIFKNDLSSDYIRSLFSYDPATGNLLRIQTGNLMGFNTWIGKRNYKTSRLCWVCYYGAWPVGLVDHRDGDDRNNRIGNLRDVSNQTNTENQRTAQAGSTSKLLGVSFYRANGTWKAQIWSEGKYKSLGYYLTPEEAHAVYVEAKRRLHEGNTL